MKRYIVEHKIISNSTGTILTVEHGIAYETLEDAAEGQRTHIENTDYICVGFRIIELEEVKDV